MDFFLSAKGTDQLVSNPLFEFRNRKRDSPENSQNNLPRRKKTDYSGRKKAVQLEN